MTQKAKYTQKAPEKANVKGRIIMFLTIVAIIIILLIIANLLPYSGILTLVVFMVGAYLIHKMLTKSVLDITYALFDDKLTFVRKYGKVEWECEVFPFNEAKFYKDKIEHRGKTYEFYPDNKLLEFLGI